ncbi:MAG: amidohydrolase family protein [Planctomycetaceae bacterium]
MRIPGDEWISDWNAAADRERSLCVAWLMNPGDPPRQNVRLTVCGTLVSETTGVADDEQSDVIPCVLIPRLMNAHTHLEFSDLRKPLQPAEPFTDWIRAVIHYRRDHAPDGVSGIRRGLGECARNGTSFVGEITTTAESEAAYHSEAGVDVLSFRELIGFLPEQIDSQLAAASAHLAKDAEPGISRGLSPHAPYSVHPDLFAAAVELAALHDVPVAMHLAETRDELQLLQNGTGRFVDFLRELGIWRPDVIAADSAPLRYLEKLSHLRASLVVHGNHLSDNELRFLCRNPHVATVYCPRTHGYFGHTLHPWKKLVAGGATVLIGTDSRASNPDLSLWKELQHLARLPDTLPWPRLLQLATTVPSAALQRNHQPLRAGNPADGVLIACEADSEGQLNSALAEPSSQPIAVLCHGTLTSSA